MLDIGKKLPYLYNFFNILDLQYHTVIMLRHYYVGATRLSFVEAVYEHFKLCALDAHSSVG